MSNIFDLFKKIEKKEETGPITHIVAGLGNPGAEYKNPQARLGYLSTLLSARKRAAEGKRIGGVTDGCEEKLILALTNEINILSQEGTT